MWGINWDRIFFLINCTSEREAVFSLLHTSANGVLCSKSWYCVKVENIICQCQKYTNKKDRSVNHCVPRGDPRGSSLIPLKPRGTQWFTVDFFKKNQSNQTKGGGGRPKKKFYLFFFLSKFYVLLHLFSKLYLLVALVMHSIYLLDLYWICYFGQKKKKLTTASGFL